MILLLIPVAAVVIGAGLWVGLRGWGALSLGVDRPERVTWRDRRAGREGRAPFSVRPDSEGLREWSDRLPAGCLIAVIVASGVWVLGWLIVLIFGLNLLS